MRRHAFHVWSQLSASSPNNNCCFLCFAAVFPCVAPSPPPSSGSLWRHPLQALAACCFLERREALHVVAAHASGFVCSLWRIHAVSSVAFGDRSIRSSRGSVDLSSSASCLKIRMRKVLGKCQAVMPKAFSPVPQPKSRNNISSNKRMEIGSHMDLQQS